MATTSDTTRIALDAAVVVQSLSREAAAMQARAVAQRALVAAATRKQLGLIAADAAVLASVYEEAAQVLYDQIDAIVSRGRSASVAAGASAASRPQGVVQSTPAAAVASTTQPGASKTAVNAPSAPPPSLPLICDVKAPPFKRYAALVALIAADAAAGAATTIAGTATTTTPNTHEYRDQLRVAFNDMSSRLPQLNDCVASLHNLDDASLPITSALQAIEHAIDARQAVRGVDQQSRAASAAYKHHVDTAVLALSAGAYAPGQQATIEEVLRQLRRLRDDVDVAIAVGAVGEVAASGAVVGRSCHSR